MICGYSSPRRFISGAAAHASAWRACCRGWARPRRARFSRSAARSRYAVTSAIAPTCSTPWTSDGSSMQAPRVTAAPRYTDSMRRWLALVLAAVGGLAAAAEAPAGEAAAAEARAGEVPAGEEPVYAASFEKVPAAAALRVLGRALFFDASLSASGKMACVTCHDSAHAFAAANGSSVQRGGAG